MEHPGEIWQELDFNGERLKGGIEPGIDDDAVKLYYGVAVMLYRFRDGIVEYLFQHRSKHLAGNPDKWDVSAGGHVNLGESQLDAIKREAREEIGIDLRENEMEIAASFLRWKIFVTLYFCDWTNQEDKFVFDDREVEEVKWVKYSQLEEFWPNLKKILAEDEIFKYYLKEWNHKILEKYGDS